MTDIPKFIFIHIGKTGGSSIRKGLRRRRPKLIYKKCIHWIPPYDEDALYLISTRDPIDRVVSAFNWRTYCRDIKISTGRGPSNSKPVLPREERVLDKYKTINNLAECLYDLDGNLNLTTGKDIRQIKHVQRGISWYWRKTLKYCTRKNILGLITTDRLSEDMERIFNSPARGIDWTHKNKHYPVVLSSQGKNNLKRFLKREYSVLANLRALTV